MNDRVSRRRILQYGAASAAALGFAGRLYAAPASGPRFLLVFLRGGYDAANMLIPYSSDFYYESRPHIAVSRPGAQGGPVTQSSEEALALDADWALAPSLRATIGPLYRRREAAFIPFTGTGDLSRSHFETQDSIELGQPLGASRDYRSGFMARLAATVNGAGGDGRAIAFTDALPLALAGPTPVPNLSLKGGGPRPFDEREARILAGMYAARGLEPVVASGLELQQQMARTMADEMRRASRNAVAPRGFELQAERMGQLMGDSYRIGFVDIGGWDTHVDEGATSGALAANLSSLGHGIGTFAESLGPEWGNTVVVVLSEFGRTFRENGDRGTDHGHGTVYWVLGGAVHGGRIAGEQVRVARETLFQDRDYPVLNDYRAVLGGLFARLWGLRSDQCRRVFPQVEPRDLGLV
ncbi:MAG: DUF1501 domain-containing protein [Steroidobacteraceae bacterium]